jgi:hypothetical protein
MTKKTAPKRPTPKHDQRPIPKAGDELRTLVEAQRAVQAGRDAADAARGEEILRRRALVDALEG